MSNNNPNNPNQGFDVNALANMDVASLLQMLSRMDMNQLNALMGQIKIDPNDPTNQLKDGDPRIGLLNSLKSLFPPENAYIIDNFIRMLTPPKK